jgi:hypothetical protein
MPTTTIFDADATSAVNDGSTVTANGATMQIGHNTGVAGKHVHLRFVTSTLVDADRIMTASLTAKLSAVGSTPITVDAWASEFGAAIAVGDYNVTASNVSPIRVKLKQIFSASSIANDVGTVTVPSRFVIKDTANSGFSDIELRPGSDWTSDLNKVMTIHGPAAASADRPKLTVVTLTDAELLTTTVYRRHAIGADSWLAFAQETTPGTAVKGKVLLDMVSSSLQQNVENGYSRALTKRRARPVKIWIGRSGGGGSVEFEMTPEKWVQLLPGIMKRTGTTGSNPYTHTFKVGEMDDMKFFTFVQRLGDFREVFAGCMLDSMEISVGMDSAVSISAGVIATDYYVYDENSAGSSDEYILGSTAGYDSVANSINAFTGVKAVIDSVDDPGFVQSVRVALRQNVQERRGLNRKRGPAGLFPLGFEVEVDFSMYFVNEAQFLKFLGNSAKEFPARTQKSIQLQQMDFKMAGALGATTQEITFSIPKMMFTAISKPINDEGAIMLDCSGLATYDDITQLSNLVVTILNSEASTVFDPSTDTITVLPPNES